MSLGTKQYAEQAINVIINHHNYSLEDYMVVHGTLCMGTWFSSYPAVMLECWSDQIDCASHDDVIKWKHFPRYSPFVRGIHRSPMNSPHKGQWRGASTFSLICAWINDWVNNREAGDLRRDRAHYGVTVMEITVMHQVWYKFNIGHFLYCSRKNRSTRFV